MKISCDRQSLHKAVQNVLGVVPQRSPKPVLQNLKLVAKAGGCELLASDFDLSIRQNVDGVEVISGGATLIPAREMNDILKEASDERVEIEQKDKQILIRTDNAEYKLLSEDPDEFPEVAEFPAKGSFTLNAETFSEMIEKTSFAVATEATRFAINGILMQIKNKEATFVGTDGKRLAMVRQRLEETDDKVKLNAIVSPKGASHATRLLAEDEKEISVWADEAQVLFKTRNSTLVSRLIEGQYPNFEEVVPKSLPKKVTLDREMLTKAIRQATLTTSDEYRAVRFEFTKNKMVLSSRTPELGETRVERAIAYNDDDLVIHFDPRFLLEGLRAMRTDEVKWELKDPGSATLMREGKTFQYVVIGLSIN